MASAMTVDKRIKNILSFASNLKSQLPAATTATANSKAPGDLLLAIQNAISILSGYLDSAAGWSAELDSTGTALWNLCTRLRRELTVDPKHTQPAYDAIIAARVFAFLLLCGSHDHGKTPAGNILRLMAIGTKAAKYCIDMKLFDVARTALEKVGKYEDSLTGLQKEPNSELRQEECNRWSSEYFILRTTLAWHLKQFIVAEYMYQKAIPPQRTFDPDTAESLANILFELGRDLLASKQYLFATKWLQRALDILTEQGLARLSIDASELRHSIIQSSVRALLRSKERGTLEKAQAFVRGLEEELGGRLVVLLLKLDILGAREFGAFDVTLYSDILQEVIRTAPLSEANFRLILFHTRTLHDRNPVMASKSLDNLLKLRIMRDQREELVERVLVTRLWITTNPTEMLDSFERLNDLLTLIVNNFDQPISSSGVVASRMLLWKRIESSYAQRQYETTEQWCRLASHRIFAHSPDPNMGPISRKRLLCAIQLNDPSIGKDAFGSMPDAIKNQPMTRFLVFQIAIRTGDVALATECLEIIGSAPADVALLYGCCQESVEAANNISQSLIPLQFVLEKYNYDPPAPFQLTSFLRATIRLTSALLSELVEQEVFQEVHVLADKLCKLFEGGVTSARKLPAAVAGSKDIWTVLELNWFSRMSYNTAIRNLSIWTPQNILRVLKCSIAFIDRLPSDITEPFSADIWLRKAFCDFSAGTALAALARGEDNLEQQLQYYLDLRQHANSFCKLLQENIHVMEDLQTRDLLFKLSAALAFEFEAACHLKAWDDLSEIVLRAAACNSIRAYELMADSLLSARAPTQVFIVTLKKIINEVWSLDTMDNITLARYMRCLFQVALSENPEMGEHLLDQILGHAEQAHSDTQRYPNEELDWIATKAFNHGVDLYNGWHDAACRNWTSKALRIAHFCDDGGALEKLLQAKIVEMQLELG